MAQTEETKRLLKINKNSPSGFEIVGYEYRKGDKVFHQRYVFKDRQTLSDPIQWFRIEHDAFELGIKVGDVDWFEGDKFKHNKYDIIGEIVYDKRYGCFCVDWYSHNDEDICISDILHYHEAGYYDSLKSVIHHENWENFKHIGNIHEDINEY